MCLHIVSGVACTQLIIYILVQTLNISLLIYNLYIDFILYISRKRAFDFLVALWTDRVEAQGDPAVIMRFADALRDGSEWPVLYLYIYMYVYM